MEVQLGLEVEAGPISHSLLTLPSFSSSCRRISVHRSSESKPPDQSAVSRQSFSSSWWIRGTVYCREQSGGRASELRRMDLLLSAIIVGAGCFALGYYIGGHHPACLPFPTRVVKDSPSTSSSKKNKSKEPLEIEKLAGILEDFKMVLVVRNDLKMGKGKIAAQCSHATLGLYKKILHRAPKALSRWEMCAQPKVVLKIESEEDMLFLQERAKSLKLPTHITIDAGRTQIAPNSRTVMAVLGPVEVVDDVTGGLKLL